MGTKLLLLACQNVCTLPKIIHVGQSNDVYTVSGQFQCYNICKCIKTSIKPESCPHTPADVWKINRELEYGSPGEKELAGNRQEGVYTSQVITYGVLRLTRKSVSLWHVKNVNKWEITKRGNDLTEKKKH